MQKSLSIQSLVKSPIVRRSQWIAAPLLLFAAVSVPTVRADTIDYTLTVTAIPGFTPITFELPSAINIPSGIIVPISGTVNSFAVDTLSFQTNSFTVVYDSFSMTGNIVGLDPITSISSGTEAITAFGGTVQAATLSATSVPEIDPTSGTSALVLVACSMLIIRGRRKVATAYGPSSS